LNAVRPDITKRLRNSQLEEKSENTQNICGIVRCSKGLETARQTNFGNN
jgi:hypothetical protein